jgi:hypothetical protein
MICYVIRIPEQDLCRCSFIEANGEWRPNDIRGFISFGVTPDSRCGAPSQSHPKHPQSQRLFHDPTSTF